MTTPVSPRKSRKHLKEISFLPISSLWVILYPSRHDEQR